jgi:predicted Zn-dependent protease
MKCHKFFINFFFIFYLFFSQANSLEIIRDTELEQFTDDIVSILLQNSNLESEDLEIYFIKSDQVNAFVTGGQNIFINTELFIKASDYREYAAVLAHELAHILGGHIFNTSIEISNLTNKAFPIYLLGIIGMITGSTDAGIAGIMVGQASLNDNFSYYSRTQEASADQAAVKILCNSGINGKYLIEFLKKIENASETYALDENNYRSTHPLVQDRIGWIHSSLLSYSECDYGSDEIFANKFELLKAKLHGFTHPHYETEAIYNSTKDADLYATAVSNYFQGNHSKSIENMKKLINKQPSNPFYNELIGEIYFANSDYKNAALYHEEAMKNIDKVNDLYHMMMGNYLLTFDEIDKSIEAINNLKKSLLINAENAYAWYLLSRAYAQTGSIALANYATAERYFLIGERELSYEFAVKALKHIEENSPEWYRSNDLIEILQKEVSKR